jgi:hypothetical protein
MGQGVEGEAMTNVLEEVSATVEVKVWVNGKATEVEDLAIGTQRLINAAEAMLPQFYFDDTREQKDLRMAVKMLRGMECFK